LPPPPLELLAAAPPLPGFGRGLALALPPRALALPRALAPPPSSSSSSSVHASSPEEESASLRSYSSPLSSSSLLSPSSSSLPPRARFVGAYETGALDETRPDERDGSARGAAAAGARRGALFFLTRCGASAPKSSRSLRWLSAMLALRWCSYADRSSASARTRLSCEGSPAAAASAASASASSLK